MTNNAPSTRPAAKPERIAKVMAAAGLCSRREAERWIAEGRVQVNGEILKTPAVTVTPQDDIVVDGKKLRSKAHHLPRVWLYHKPKERITSTHDPEGRLTVFDDLPSGMPRVVAVGRLDYMTEGLLLFTTDGGLARQLELPSNKLRRIYRVRAMGNVSDEALRNLRQGGQYTDPKTGKNTTFGPVKAQKDKSSKDGKNQWLIMEISEGKNREIRNICDGLGLRVSRLIRTHYAVFSLEGLAPGTVAEAPAAVVQSIIEKLGGRDADHRR